MASAGQRVYFENGYTYIDSFSLAFAERGESIGGLLSGETPTGDLFCGFDMGEKPS